MQGLQEFPREEVRTLGYERAYARSYPNVRGLPRQFPESPDANQLNPFKTGGSSCPNPNPPLLSSLT
jgi:hypothetical protein